MTLLKKIQQKEFSNLQSVQKEDMTQYLQLNDETLIILKDFISKLQEKVIA